MKQVNFSHSGGFPLEQETLERLQTAYRSELFEALKSHLSITTNENYIVAMSTADKQGWAVIHQYEKDPKDAQALLVLQGILYPIAKGDYTGYLKTTRTGVNLVYGTGVSQTAYFDYEAEYISEFDYVNGISENSDALRIEYYDLANFKIVKDIQSIQDDIDTINQTYLPLDGSKAMKGDLDLDIYQLSKLDIKETPTANVRVTDFRLGSNLGRALVNNNTKLTLNYNSDWQNTSIGGKVYLENLNTSNSIGSFLAIDSSNQVTKNNMVIDLLDRITVLESKITTATAVFPLGMIAIWGKPAPFPEGWEEYVPLRGRMPVGLNIAETEFNTIDKFGGTKSYGLSVPVPLSGYNYSENTSNGTSGKLVISTGKQELGENLESVAIVSASPNINLTVNNLSPYKVVQFIEYTGVTSDKTLPTSPTLKASNTTNKSTILSWTAATDNVGVTNYLISINGAPPFSVGNILTYNVTGLSEDTSYDFYVISKDAAGNVSNKSNKVSIITGIAPTYPLNIQAYSEGQGKIGVEWDASTGGNGPIIYELYRKTVGGNYSKITETSLTSYMDNGLASTTYYYQVQAVDAQKNESGFYSYAHATTDPPVGSCFDVESLVTMASGQSKKLKNILIGDKLQGLTFPNEIDESDGDYMIWSGKLNEAAKAEVTVVNKITSIQPDYYEIKTADTTLKVTGQHPLLVSEDGENVKWVCVKNVLPTMLLIDKTGKTKAIESILFVEEPLEVALLDVETVDNYVISGIVAHNIKPID
jgi:hypothetical protein